MSTELIWHGEEGIELPNDITDIQPLVEWGVGLSERQKGKIVSAFQVKAFDMGIEYVWKITLGKLKSVLSIFGLKFIAEMLEMEDVESRTIDNILNDYTVIHLSEKLGILNTTASMKMKHSLEVLNHYFSTEADGELNFIASMDIAQTCVKYVLGKDDISADLQFINVRERLLEESFDEKSEVIEALSAFPLFYLKTIYFVLLYTIRNDQGAKQANALANLNSLIGSTWKKLGEKDKWNIGFTYRDVVTGGDDVASRGIKKALTKVHGFDFVPENLRSSTFKKAAASLIRTHFELNNFYNEPSLTKSLASLGSSIPVPALVDCIQAYLLVYMGNNYGISNSAVPIAEEQLSKITKDRWQYYFSKALNTDEYTLGNLTGNKQISRLNDFLIKYSLNDFNDLPRQNQKLYDAITNKKIESAKKSASYMLSKLRNK